MMRIAQTHVVQLEEILRKLINPATAPPVGDVFSFQGQLIGLAVGWDESVYITDQ